MKPKKARWCKTDYTLLLEEGNMGKNMILHEEYRYRWARQICMQKFFS